MAEKLKVTLVKSPISAIPKHRATVKALGLTKMHGKQGSRQVPLLPSVHQYL